MKRSQLPFAILLSCLLFVFSCSDDDPASPTLTNPTFTISGTLQIKSGIAIPEGATLSAIWSVDAAGDYAYVFGNGTVDQTAGTFSITFDTPPALALNTDPDGVLPSFGVGYIVLANFTTNEPHILQENELQDVIGAVSNIGMIYVDGDPGAYSSHSELNWISAFKSGYAIGKGKETTQTHDIFVPSTASTFVLTVTDDPKDLVFPNWK